MGAGRAKSRFSLPAGLSRSGPKRRPIRVADAVRAVIADLLLRKVKDPRLRNVAITGAEISDDLGHAWVLYSILGDDDPKEVARGLESARGFFRTGIAKSLELRHVPIIEFRLDLAGQKQAEIENLLREIAQEDESS